MKKLMIAAVAMATGVIFAGENDVYLVSDMDIATNATFINGNIEGKTLQFHHGNYGEERRGETTTFTMSSDVTVNSGAQVAIIPGNEKTLLFDFTGHTFTLGYNGIQYSCNNNNDGLEGYMIWRGGTWDYSQTPNNCYVKVLGRWQANATDDRMHALLDGVTVKADKSGCNTAIFTGTKDCDVTISNSTWNAGSNEFYAFSVGNTADEVKSTGNKLLINGGSKVIAKCFSTDQSQVADTSKILETNNETEFSGAGTTFTSTTYTYIGNALGGNIVKITDGATFTSGDAFAIGVNKPNSGKNKAYITNGATLTVDKEGASVNIGHNASSSYNEFHLDNATLNANMIWIGASGSRSIGNKCYLSGKNSNINLASAYWPIAFGCREGLLEISDGAKINTGSDFRMVHTAGCDANTIRLTSGAEFTTAASFMFGGYDDKKNANNIAANDCLLEVSDGAILTTTQFMNSGMNDTVVISNGTIKGTTQFAFYIGHSSDDTGHEVSGNMLIMKGNHPRVQVTASNGRFYVENGSVLRFELPEDGEYLETPVTCGEGYLGSAAPLEITNYEALLADCMANGVAKDITLIAAGSAGIHYSDGFFSKLPYGIKVKSQSPNLIITVGPQILDVKDENDYTIASNAAIGYDVVNIENSKVKVNGSFQIGTDSSPSDNHKWLMKDSTFTLAGQIMINGTNNHMVVDNSVVLADYRFAIYLGRSASAASADNTITLKGAQPRIIAKHNAHDTKDTSYYEEGAPYEPAFDDSDFNISKVHLIFELTTDPSAIYTEPVIQAGHGLSFDPLDVTFKNLEELQANVKEAIEIPLIQTLGLGGYGLIGADSFKAMVVGGLPAGCSIIQKVGVVVPDSKTDYLRIEPLPDPCAEIDGVIYRDFDQAIRAVKENQTIKLVADVTIPSGLQLQDYKHAPFTLDLNGKNLWVKGVFQNKDNTNGYPQPITLIVPEGSTLHCDDQLMINGAGNKLYLGGTIQVDIKYAFYFGYENPYTGDFALANDVYITGPKARIVVDQNPDLAKKGTDCWFMNSNVHYDLSKGVYENFIQEAIANVVVYEPAKGCKIEFTGVEDIVSGLEDGEEILVPLARSEKANSLYYYQEDDRILLGEEDGVPDGCELVFKNDVKTKGDRAIYLKIAKPNPVVSYNDEEYSSIAKALKLIELDGGEGTITFIKDATINSTLTVNAGSNITIDLNGYTVTAEADDYALTVAGAEGEEDTVYANVFVTDSSEGTPGKIVKTGQGTVVKVAAYGALTTEKVGYAWDGDKAGTNVGKLIKVEANGYLEVASGSFESTDAARCYGIQICEGVDQDNIAIKAGDFYENATFNVAEGLYAIDSDSEARFKFDASAVCVEGYYTKLDGDGWYYVAEGAPTPTEDGLSYETAFKSIAAYNAAIDTGDFAGKDIYLVLDGVTFEEGTDYSLKGQELHDSEAKVPNPDQARPHIFFLNCSFAGGSKGKMSGDGTALDPAAGNRKEIALDCVKELLVSNCTFAAYSGDTYVIDIMPFNWFENEGCGITIIGNTFAKDAGTRTPISVKNKASFCYPPAFVKIVGNTFNGIGNTDTKNLIDADTTPVICYGDGPSASAVSGGANFPITIEGNTYACDKYAVMTGIYDGNKTPTYVAKDAAFTWTYNEAAGGYAPSQSFFPNVKPDISAVSESDGKLVLSFQTIKNEVYNLKATTKLGADAVWGVEQSILGDGTTKSFEIEMEGAEAKFFKVAK